MGRQTYSWLSARSITGVHAGQCFLRARPARARVSGGAVATKCSAALLQCVGLGGRLVSVCGYRHVRLRKELLQALVLVWQDADIVLESFRHALPIIQDDEGKEAAMILI